MDWIGLGQNFRKKYGLDWIGSEIDWIGLEWIKKIGPMSNSVVAELFVSEDGEFQTAGDVILQESRAIAKKTARCALYMDALKISGVPAAGYAHGYFSRNC